MRDESNWKNGMFGLITGDALGCPVEFCSREQLKADPVTEMKGYGTHGQPAGTWTDDSSMAIATLHSILVTGGINPEDMMQDFVAWRYGKKYTPWGEVFDIGNSCAAAISRYKLGRDISDCGRRDERSNGNGSLMRILPACIYLAQKNMPDNISLQAVYDVSSITHAHKRSLVACGIYYFCVKSIISNRSLSRKKNMYSTLLEGLDNAFDCIKSDELKHFERLKDLYLWGSEPEQSVSSDSYVVSTLNASLWCLLNTDDYRQAALKAVNLGGDTDTTAAVTGGLAGLYYGYSSIPKNWIRVLAKRKDIQKMCRLAEKNGYVRK